MMTELDDEKSWTRNIFAFHAYTIVGGITGTKFVLQFSLIPSHSSVPFEPLQDILSTSTGQYQNHPSI